MEGTEGLATASMCFESIIAMLRADRVGIYTMKERPESWLVEEGQHKQKRKKELQ